MPRKCCVPKCTTNYKTGARGTVFRFPDDMEEKEKWLRSIPRKRKGFTVKKNTVVCENHWPIGYERYTYYGKDRPLLDPPSVFPNIPKSCLTSHSRKITTRKALSANRSILADEMEDFIQLDLIPYDNIAEKVQSMEGVIGFEEVGKEMYIIQSTSIQNGIPAFMLCIKKSLQFFAYHQGIACKITTLTKNKIKKLKNWSSVEEGIRYLKTLDDRKNQRKSIIHQHLEVAALFTLGCFGTIYPTSMIVRCFEYFARSRALYSRLCKDYNWPCVRTLTRFNIQVQFTYK